MRQHNHYSLILLLFLPAILGMLGSCSSESGNDPAPPASSAGFSIATRATTTESAGSLYGDPDPTRPEELISSWIAIFIKDGEVAEVAEVVRSKTASSSSPVEKEYFMPKNLTGTASYDIIAFANIPEEDLTAAGIPLTEGAAADVAALAGKSWEIANNAFKPGEKAVPMSGIRRGVKITDNLEVSPGHSGQLCVIELIRMLAKVELKVRNSSESPLYLSGVGFGVLNKGNVPLFPDYVKLKDGSEPEILQTLNDSESRKGNTETASVNLPDGDREIDGEVRSVVFYVRESSAITTHPTFRFFITLTMADAGGEVRKEHYSPTDELQWINRNDHIVIPVSISDISVDWDVLFYPPIGGHPAVRTETDGDAYFMTFSTAGKFVIRPSVKNADGTPLPVESLTFTVNSITDADGNVLDLSSPSGSIFTKFPAKTNSGEIIGELNTSTGTAVMNCTLEFSYTKNNETLTEKRTRNLYIIRD